MNVTPLPVMIKSIIVVLWKFDINGLDCLH